MHRDGIPKHALLAARKLSDFSRSFSKFVVGSDSINPNANKCQQTMKEESCDEKIPFFFLFEHGFRFFLLLLWRSLQHCCRRIKTRHHIVHENSQNLIRFEIKYEQHDKKHSSPTVGNVCCLYLCNVSRFSLVRHCIFGLRTPDRNNILNDSNRTWKQLKFMHNKNRNYLCVNFIVETGCDFTLA